ncbi:MAG: glycerol-3-phosphate 1-O-acyltransferase PlsY, partial [Hyphomicrobiales bacterium]
MIMLYALAAICGYFSGSIPFGIVLTRLAGQGDIRDIGSGNIGATNVLRTGSKKLAAATLLCDFLKGMLPALIFSQWSIWAGVVAGLAAFLGHIFPVWLKFKGGKGVATYLGVITGLYWPAAIIFAIAWLAVALISRYSSLAGIIAPIAVAVSQLFIQNTSFFWPFL